MKKIFIFLMGIAIACTDQSELSSQNQRDNETAKSSANHFEDISSYKLPDKLDFCGEAVPLDIEEVKERAEREFYLLLQQPGQILLYLKRAGRYFPMYEKILKEQGVPDDLKYLSVAESALYMARSPKGAVGLWQFMSATARSLGLQVDDFVDERRHPEKSTVAAIKYLKGGYRKQKSWTSAAAGYNMGHGGFNENLNFQDGDSFYDLYLNDETSRYILRIVIIKEFMNNAEKYGFKLNDSDFYKPYEQKIVKVKSKISNLSDWAKKQGTTYKFVKLMNPWIKKRELPKPKNGAYEIAVPK